MNLSNMSDSGVNYVFQQGSNETKLTDQALRVCHLQNIDPRELLPKTKEQILVIEN